MRSQSVKQSDAGKRLDRFVSGIATGVSSGLIQKYIRLKRVKVNQKPAKADYRLVLGDQVDMYLSDDCFAGKVDRLYEGFRERLWVVYEDNDILIVDKKPGLIAHPDDTEKVNTLITHIRAYLYHKGEWSAREGDFTPAICNRLDRFTGGLVIAAKNRAALDVINAAIRDNKIVKRYACVCHARPNPSSGELRNYIVPNGSRVSVSPYQVAGGKLAITRYRTLETRGGLSLVEAELITGRTHQIRAQMANAGNPILGDMTYGKKDDQARYGRSYQALYAVSLTFDDGLQGDFAGRTFSVTAPFVKEYFP